MTTVDHNTSARDRRAPDQQTVDGTSAFLEKTLWKALQSSERRDDRIEAWLSLLILSIGNVEAGVVVLRSEDGSKFMPVATWPAGSEPPEPLAHAAETAVEKGRGVVLTRGKEGQQSADMAVPIEVEGSVRGVVALTSGPARPDSIDGVFRRIQWAIAWIREFLVLAELHGTREIRDKATTALELFAIALEEDRIQQSCRAVVTELARRFQCDRVSIGFLRRGRTDVFVISHTAQFSEQMNLVRLIGEAMDEAVDQRAIIRYPADPNEPLAVRAHEDLSRKHRATAILTLPLFVKDRFIGALTFERVDGDGAFSERDVGVLDYVAACLAPMLNDKRDLDRLLVTKIWMSFERMASPVFGPGNFGRKLLLLALAVLTGLAYFVETTYRVTADARIEGSVQRSITAPYDGFIQDALTRPGDVVEKDARLVSLDDRDLVLERLKWVTEREKQSREYDRALSERNRAEVRIITTRIEQADAQIALINEQLERASLYAPFAGVVISGDLSQRIGDAVRKGETLMEVAPLDSYRVILSVDESQFEDVDEDQDGELVVASLPDVAFPIRVTKIVPASHVADGRTVFRVEATLAEKTDRLRPGMKGVAKLEVDRRRVAWVWTRPFLHWLRLFVWRWLP